MLAPFHKQRRIITGIALGVWLFALFAGIAHGCGWAERTSSRVHAGAGCASEGSSDDSMPVGCEQFCETDLPVAKQIPSLDDPLDTTPLIWAVASIPLVLIPPPAVRLAQVAVPASDLPPFRRFSHLRL